MPAYGSSRPKTYYNSKSLTNLNLVLDLDETLVHTMDDDGVKSDKDILLELEKTHPRSIEIRDRLLKAVSTDIGVKRGYGSKYRFCSVLRPHLEEFLKFCFEYFRVVSVWSAGQRGYVEAVVRHIFMGVQDPDFVFSRDELVTTYKGSYEKPLMHLRDLHPLAEKYFTPQNTLVLDDNYRTFIKVNPDNAVEIPVYSPEPTFEDIMKEDDHLLKVKYWLLSKEVMNSKDVRTLNKKIFDIPLEDLKSRASSY